jgi:hypothetical protein
VCDDEDSFRLITMTTAASVPTERQVKMTAQKMTTWDTHAAAKNYPKAPPPEQQAQSRRHVVTPCGACWCHAQAASVALCWGLRRKLLHPNTSIKPQGTYQNYCSDTIAGATALHSILSDEYSNKLRTRPLQHVQPEQDERWAAAIQRVIASAARQQAHLLQCTAPAKGRAWLPSSSSSAKWGQGRAPPQQCPAALQELHQTQQAASRSVR